MSLCWDEGLLGDVSAVQVFPPSSQFLDKGLPGCESHEIPLKVSLPSGVRLGSPLGSRLGRKAGATWAGLAVKKAGLLPGCYLFSSSLSPHSPAPIKDSPLFPLAPFIASGYFLPNTPTHFWLCQLYVPTSLIIHCPGIQLCLLQTPGLLDYRLP